YTANVNAIIDEPEGDIDSDIKKDSVWTNFKNLGRIKNYTHNIVSSYTLPFDKIPVTDWISSSVSYQAVYNWKAGAIGQADTLGNYAGNTREISLNGKLDLVKLYNNIGILKKVNSPPRARTRPQAQNPNDSTKQRKTIEEMPTLKGLLRALMMVRSLNFDYSVAQGTVLPGYMPEVFLFGLDKDLSNPSLGFIVGGQNPAIRTQLAESGLYAQSTFLTAPR
uniref:hypothetical protein n=1 Tax=Roseivirga sp. TaxID=1964215 RepID=UPI004048525C